MSPFCLSPLNWFRSLWKPYFQLPSGIWALFAAIMINRMGNFVFPFLTLYLTQKAGYSIQQTGFFVMLLPLAVVPALALGGIVADRWGRKRLLVTGQALSGFCYIGASFWPEGPFVPVMMVVATFLSNMAQIGHNAMLNDLTTTDNRKTAFSLNYLGINIGFSIGPLIAGFLFSQHLGAFFLIDGLTTLASATLVGKLVTESLHQETQGPRASGEAQASKSFWKALTERPYYLGFLAINFLVAMVYGQHTFSLPLQLTQTWPEGGAVYYGWMMAINGITVVVFSTVLNRITNRFPSLVVVAAASGFYVLGFGAIGFFGTWGHGLVFFAITTVIWTLGEILASVGGQVYLGSHTPANQRGRFSSFRSMVQNLAQATTSAVTGLYIGCWGVQAVWPAAAGLAFVCMVLFWTMHRREQNYLSR